MMINKFKILILLCLSVFLFYSCDDSGEKDRCGNNFRDFDEECDGEDLGSQSCQTLGFNGGELSCTSSCKYNLTSCEQYGKCGDGIIQDNEDCEDEDLQNKTCSDLGFDFGELKCGTDCKYDVSLCEKVTCGNSIIEGNEECDGTNLSVTSCQELGYHDGLLSCNEDCTFNKTQCEQYGKCGDAVIQSGYGEECEGSNLNGAACSDVLPGSYDDTVLKCGTDCKYDVSSCGYCGDEIIQLSDGEECDGTQNPYLCKDLGAWFGTTSCDASCQPSLNGCYYTLQDGGLYIDSVFDGKIDGNGNIYVTGYTSSLLAGNATFGGFDIFVMKFTSDGTKLWTRQFGSDQDDQAFSLVLSSSNDIYVTGYTAGSLDGNLAFGGNDIFVMKLTSDGTKIWTKQFGTSGNDSGKNIVVANNGNIIVTGNVNGSLDGHIIYGEQDMFLAEFTSDGTKVWTKQFGTSGNDFSVSMTVDTSDNIYVTGYVNGSLDGNSFNYYVDVFLLKTDMNGTTLWSREWGSESGDYGTSVNINSNGVYVTGHTNASLDGNTQTGGLDIFVSLFTFDGTKLWTKQFGTDADDKSSSAFITLNGDIYISGDTDGTWNNNTSSGGYDIFLMKIDSSGNLLSVVQRGTLNLETCHGMVQDPRSYGDFNGTVYLLGDTLGTFSGQIKTGSFDFFISKFVY